MSHGLPLVALALCASKCATKQVKSSFQPRPLGTRPPLNCKQRHTLKTLESKPVYRTQHTDKNHVQRTSRSRSHSSLSSFNTPPLLSTNSSSASTPCPTPSHLLFARPRLHGIHRLVPQLCNPTPADIKQRWLKMQSKFISSHPRLPRRLRTYASHFERWQTWWWCRHSPRPGSLRHKFRLIPFLIISWSFTILLYHRAKKICPIYVLSRVIAKMSRISQHICCIWSNGKHRKKLGKHRI